MASTRCMKWQNKIFSQRDIIVSGTIVRQETLQPHYHTASQIEYYDSINAVLKAAAGNIFNGVPANKCIITQCENN